MSIGEVGTEPLYIICCEHNINRRKGLGFIHRCEEKGGLRQGDTYLNGLYDCPRVVSSLTRYLSASAIFEVSNRVFLRRSSA
jgi:hypothetical protein